MIKLGEKYRMNLAVFSTKPYDKEYFEKFKNEYDIKISYYEANLKPNTAKLTKWCTQQKNCWNYC